MARRKSRLSTTEPQVTQELLNTVRQQASPLQNSQDLDPLLKRIGDAKYVLLGEASHGTHEFYTWRAEITRRLIQEQGFTLVAVEGDWPDCYCVNQYVRGSASRGDSAHDVLHAFNRWPTWMWANHEVQDFVEWLRNHNDRIQAADSAGSLATTADRHRPAGMSRKTGFYGLDVYSLWDSLYHLVVWLREHNPAALPAARRAFHCFEPYGEDVQKYARASRLVDRSCEDAVVDLLLEVRRTTQSLASEDVEATFHSLQNALVVRNAEQYYRTMVNGGPESWNVRDWHMVETLERLMLHHPADSRIVVWAHNTHVGDARFTDMAEDGMVNVGQILREQHGEENVVLVGFSSHRGHVIAGDAWEAPMERVAVPAGRINSWEDVLHRACESDALLLLDALRDDHASLQERGHRAIGVVYRPEYEQFGNYVPTVLPRRYDAMLFIDSTTALQPLLDVQVAPEQDLPETYPSGL